MTTSLESSIYAISLWTYNTFDLTAVAVTVAFEEEEDKNTYK